MDLLWLGHRYAGFWRVIGGSRKWTIIISRAWIRWFLELGLSEALANGRYRI